MISHPRHLLLIAALIVLCPCGIAQSGSPAAYTPSLDLSSIDHAVDPCKDFYRYACGGWQKNNPIPPDQVSWDVTDKMYEANLRFLRGLLEEAARARKRDEVTREIGDFYAACMDEPTIHRRGVAAIQPELKAINEVQNRRDLAPLVAHLQLEFSSNPIIFGVGSRTDFDDSTRKIAGINQGGLGLPDRDYYVSDSTEARTVRERYLQHVQKVFLLLGLPAGSAKANAASVMRIEAALAAASLTPGERRDPYKTRNKMTIGALSRLAPNFDWPAYFRALNAPQFDTLNVGAPSFFKEFSVLLETESIGETTARSTLCPLTSSQISATPLFSKGIAISTRSVKLLTAMNGP